MNSRWMIPVALIGIVMVGCAGSGDDICTRAILHLEKCLNTTAAMLPDTCDPTKASKILETDCAGFGAGAGERGTYGWFDWLTGDDGPDCTEYHQGESVPWDPHYGHDAYEVGYEIGEENGFGQVCTPEGWVDVEDYDGWGWWDDLWDDNDDEGDDDEGDDDEGDDDDWWDW